jgi:hypothetical protein
VVRMLDDTRFKTGTQIVWVIVILLGGAIGAIVTWRSGAHRGRNHCAAAPGFGSRATAAAQWNRVALLR